MSLDVHLNVEPVPALTSHLMAWALVAVLGVVVRGRGGGSGGLVAGLLGLLSLLGAAVLQLLFVFAAEPLWDHGRVMQWIELACGAGHVLAQIVLGLSLLRALWRR
ncbi:MAG: hypothetical protein H6742_13500 [Alphaproteobacteria bacterium]|nr:hypothetical protein [Alphaproteobacteria bacterium]